MAKNKVMEIDEYLLGVISRAAMPIDSVKYCAPKNHSRRSTVSGVLSAVPSICKTREFLR